MTPGPRYSLSRPIPPSAARPHRPPAPSPQCERHGLTVAEAAERLITYGPNKLPEEKRNPFLIYLGYLNNPLSWAMEVGGGKQTLQP